MPEEECDSGVMNDSTEGLDSTPSALPDSDAVAPGVTGRDESGEGHLGQVENKTLDDAGIRDSPDEGSSGAATTVNREDDDTCNDNIAALPNGLDASGEMAPADMKTATLAGELSTPDIMPCNEDESSVGAKTSSESAES